jgi:UDP-N-acetylglucosamine acyltransferase
MTEEVCVIREIAPGARISPDARVGAFCTVGPEVAIGAGTVLESRVTVAGATTIGRDNLIQSGSVLGAAPQDLKYHGKRTLLIIGDRNRLGPKVTAHVGTEEGGYLTRIGDDNVLEAGAHVAHDCFLDDRTRLGPSVLLAGHIRIETGAVVEEMTGVHHFTTIGRFSRVGGGTPVVRDVPPFTYFASLRYYNTPAAVRGCHEAGLRQAGLPAAEAQAVRQAIRELFHNEQALAVAVEKLLARPDLPEAAAVLGEFCRRCLASRFGRCREEYRGRMPPEARAHLPADVLAKIEGGKA